MLIFATDTDLTDPDPPWLGTVPDNAPTLLRYASIDVAKACQISLYDPAPTGQTADVLRDATCAQVASWVALGVDPAKAGTDMPGPVKAKSAKILDADVSETRDTTAAISAMADARDGLCALATDLLQTAGLLWLPLPLGDATPYLPTYGLSGPFTLGERGPELYYPGLPWWQQPYLDRSP